MNDFLEIYRRIEYLRNKGVKMKDIAECANLLPSVLSALYTTVFPAYFEAVKKSSSEEALDYALSQVNNVSKKRLLGNIGKIRQSLEAFEPEATSTLPDDSFAGLWNTGASENVSEIENFSGIYLSYSLSSSSDALKVEPYLISRSENGEYIRIGRLSAYRAIHWGTGIINNHQNLYISFSETPAPQLSLVTLYLQLPFREHPGMLRGLYLALDYNRNPIARRIVLVKQTSSTDVTEFLNMQGGMIIPKEKLTPQQEVYYNYTCQPGDFIKMCTVPSPRLDESDLEREKKMLEL